MTGSCTTWWRRWNKRRLSKGIGRRIVATALMIFTDPCFLFLFLPVVLAVYYFTPRAGKNFVLLGASVIFYALGEGWSTFVVLASIVINFIIGHWIQSVLDGARARSEEAEGAETRAIVHSPDDRKRAWYAIAIGVFVNLLLLCVFKYLAFIVGNLNDLLVAMHVHAACRCRRFTCRSAFRFSRSTRCRTSSMSSGRK